MDATVTEDLRRVQAMMQGRRSLSRGGACFAVTALWLLLALAGVCLAQEGQDAAVVDEATEAGGHVAHRYGMALSFAQGVGLPDNYGMGLVTLIGLFDYDRIWPHRAPDPLRFKVELTGGSTTWPEAPRAVVSANILALYYLESLAGAWGRPFVEAGIGGIYTDFQVEGQGSRVNFNPVAGFGLEFDTMGGQTWFTAIRASHWSNAGILEDNQGVNTFAAMLGLYF